MGILQHTLDFNFGEVAHVKFSPDSKLIALFSDKKLVTIWNTSTGFVQQTLNHSDVVLRVVFSQDSKLLASISGKKIMIWNISTDFVQQTFDLGYIADVIEFSPDSKLLASSSHNRRLFPLRFYVKIMIWNISTGSVQQTFDQSEPIRVIAFSHDSRLLALSGSETIKIWNIHTDFVQQTIAINDRISSLSFDSTNSNLLTNTGDIKIKKTGFFITSKSPQEKDDTPYFRGLNISESWIKWNNRKLLWLPPDYRLKVSISPSRSIVAIDRGAGEVSIIGFSSAILGNLLDC
jgi:WD40 repeat protein